MLRECVGEDSECVKWIPGDNYGLEAAFLLLVLEFTKPLSV